MASNPAAPVAFGVTVVPAGVADAVQQANRPKLVPYQLLYKMPRLRTVEDMDTERRHYNSLAAHQSRQDLDLPDFDERLAKCVDIIEHAVGCGVLPPETRDRQMGLAHATFNSMEHCLVPRNEKPADFFYLIAGGFVVSGLLGHGEWEDIDVWFTPRRNADGQWMGAWGRRCYPVNVLIVNDLLSHIRTFDLDICKCVIQVIQRGTQREYRFLLTRECAYAWMHACTTMRPFHPAIADGARLMTRLRKYADRDLDVRDSDMAKFGRVPAELYPAVQDMSEDVRSRTAAWQITVSNRRRIARVDFCLVEEDETVLNTLSCLPAIVYPCQHTGVRYDIGSTVRSLLDIAYAPGDVHWLLRALAGKPSLIAFPEVGRVWSNLVQPEWFLQRRGLTEEELVKRVRQELPVVDSRSEGVEKYLLRCSLSARPMILLKDWRMATATSEYGPGFMVFVDSSPLRSLRTQMFCVDSMDLCEECAHTRREQFRTQ